MRQKKALSSNNRTFLAMTIPIVILFFLFNTLPLITGAVYSFTNYRGYGSFDFVGLRNYIDLFSDERVLHSYLFTFKYAIAGTILINVLSLLLAMGLNSRIRCKSLLRGVYFVPNILGGLIVGYIFSFIFTYIIPAVGKAMHIGFLENSILASEKYAWIGVLIVGVWQAVAMNTIIYRHLRGWHDRRRKPVAEVLEADIPHAAALRFHQSDPQHQKHDDGIRPDHVFDQRWSGTEYRIHLVSDL